MKLKLIAAIAAAVIALALPAYGDDVLRGKDGYGRPMAIRLQDGPCAPEVTRWMPTRIKPEYHEEFRAAVLTYDGRDWLACWLDDDGDVYVLDEEGVIFNRGEPLPRSAFRDPSI